MYFSEVDLGAFVKDSFDRLLADDLHFRADFHMERVKVPLLRAIQITDALCLLLDAETIPCKMNEPLRVGVHLWRPAKSKPPAYLVIAHDPCSSVSHDRSMLVAVERLLESADCSLLHVSGSTCWRVCLR